MSRIPFIAGNWKMHKTVAEAEQFIAGAAAARRGRRRRRDRHLPAVPGARRRSSTRRAARRSAIYAQTMHEADEGAFTGEVSAPMLAEIDVARRHPRPLRAAPALQRDRQGAPAQGARRRWTTGLDADPLRRRDRGRARARRDRAQAPPPGAGGAREGAGRAAAPRSSIAYEPVWAIGTGLVATPDAGAGGGRVRPRAGRGPRQGRGRAGPDPLRRLVQARQRGRAAGAARRRRRARRRREPRAGPTSRAIVEIAAAAAHDRPGGLPRRARRLGPRARRPGQRGRARRHAGVRRPVGRAPAHDADRQGRGRRPARGPDGQLRGRPPQPRRRRDRAAGPRAHRRGRRGRHAGRERDAAARRCAAPSACT